MHALLRDPSDDQFFKAIGVTARYHPNGQLEYGPRGFIHHPADHPVRCRRVLNWRRAQTGQQARSKLGLCFESTKFVSPGSAVELTIPLRGELQKFRGEVVLVRDIGFGYEIGVWLESDEDAARVRIVEQICHIECYLKEKREREGHAVIRENAAQEWIAKFAASFPVF